MGYNFFAITRSLATDIIIENGYLKLSTNGVEKCFLQVRNAEYNF
jgi:hypothetical protein